MEEKNKREEIQSRREFFKKAAKAALPVVGAVILSSVPFIKAEAVNGCRGCSGGCSHGCGSSCYQLCEGYTSKVHPSGDCPSCTYYCKGCEGQCNGACSGSCVRSSY